MDYLTIFLIIVIAISFFFLIAYRWTQRSAADQAGSNVSALELVALKIDSMNCSLAHGTISTAGTVSNISQKPLPDIVVIGLFKAEDEVLISSSSQLLENRNMNVGERSVFKVSVDHNSRIKKCEVKFMDMAGHLITAGR